MLVCAKGIPHGVSVCSIEGEIEKGGVGRAWVAWGGGRSGWGGGWVLSQQTWVSAHKAQLWASVERSF